MTDGARREPEPGDRVRPLPAAVMARQGTQTVLAVYSHPVTGEWLWLVTDDGIVGSFAAMYWEIAPGDDAVTA